VAERGARLLVADDNKVNRLLMARNLALQGHQVESAENGRVALDMLRGEFESMPGLRLTLPQVARLLALDPEVAEVVIERLEAEGLLVRDGDVAYRRSAPLLS